MARWAGEMEFEFIEGKQDDGSAFVATDKIITFLRNHLAKGEVQAAARLYEDTGANAAAALIEETKTASSNTQKATAEMFFLARDFLSAAKVLEIARVIDRAALLYEQGGDFISAARCFEKQADLVRAASCLERAGKIDEAVALYRKAGPSESLAEALARQQHYYDAAAVYRVKGNLKAEIEMLRLVPLTNENRVPAVLRLAELLEQYNHPDQAVGLLIDTVRQCESARMHQPLFMTLARMLETLGRTNEAAQVRARIQNLLSGAPEAKAAPVVEAKPATPAAPAATAAVVGEVIPVVQGKPAVQPSGPFTSGLSPRAGAVPIDEMLARPGGGGSARDPFAAVVDPFGAKRDEGADSYGHLKAIPIFAELALPDMRDLFRACQEVTFAPGGVLIEQGVAGIGLFVLVHGTVRVVRVDGQGEQMLAKLGPGSYVGELSLLDDAPTSARVVADEPVFALVIARERFQEFLYAREGAAMRIYRLFARTLAERLRASNIRRS